MNYFYLVLAFVTNGAANILLKVGADRGINLDFSGGIGKLLTHHFFLLSGIFLFAINVLFYVAALRTLPLSTAYPIMVGMSFLIANGAALIFLREPIGWVHLIGFVLIVTGITIIVRYA